MFFHIFKILIFQVVRGGQKPIQNDKKFCPLHSISQEPYIIWYLQVFFFIFSKFWFSGSIGAKRAKNGPEWQKIMSVMPCISGIIHHVIVNCGANVWNVNITRSFFHVKILIFQVFKGLKGKKGPKWRRFLSVHLGNHISYDLHPWYKRIIYPGIFFHFFSKFWFWRSLGS